MARSGHAARAAPLALMLTLAACVAGPPYPPPTDAEAGSAVRASLTADAGADPPSPRQTPGAIVPGDAASALGHRTAATLQQATDEETRAVMRRNLATPRRISITRCRWTKVGPGKVRRLQRPRMGRVGRAYLCRYEEFHLTPSRGPVRAVATGYFYKSGDGFLHAEVSSSGFEPVRAIPEA